MQLAARTSWILFAAQFVIASAHKYCVFRRLVFGRLLALPLQFVLYICLSSKYLIFIFFFFFLFCLIFRLFIAVFFVFTNRIAFLFLFFLFFFLFSVSFCLVPLFLSSLLIILSGNSLPTTNRHCTATSARHWSEGFFLFFLCFSVLFLLFSMCSHRIFACNLPTMAVFSGHIVHFFISALATSRVARLSLVRGKQSFSFLFLAKYWLLQNAFNLSAFS